MSHVKDIRAVLALLIIVITLTGLSFARLAQGASWLEGRTHQELLKLPPWHGDVETPEAREERLLTVAKASVAAAKGDREVLAFLFVYGWRESHYALHVHAGRCRDNECDRGKAVSPWQFWRVADVSDGQWYSYVGTELQPTSLAAQYAARLFRMKRRMCGSTLGGLIAYGSGKCRSSTRIYAAKSRLAAMRAFERALK